MDRLVSNTKYLGDSSKADFVYSGEPLIYNNQVLLTMPANSVGTLLASTVYMWYGKTTAKLTTSGGQGVVTAFILLGDTKDEIDFEFVGYDLAQAQTNYYFQGFLNCKFYFPGPPPHDPSTICSSFITKRSTSNPHQFYKMPTAAIPLSQGATP